MTYVCKACGTEQPKPHAEAPSSFVVEVLVWLGALLLAGVFQHWIFLVGALAFSLWRYTANRPGKCARCQSTEVIPADSPIGRQLLEQARRGQGSATSGS